MRVKATDTKDTFSPVMLTLTFDSLDEAQKFFAIFNYTPICRSFDVNCEKPRAIREALKRLNPLIESEKSFEELKSYLTP